MKKKLLLWAVLFPMVFSYAQTPTWSGDIAPILYQHCTPCHHEGGLAPFSLIRFSDAWSQRFNVAQAVSQREMPPWLPDPSYRHFTGERYLADSLVVKINDWVNGGAPMGDTSTAPAPPVYLNQSALGGISATWQCPSYTIPSISSDLYRCFVVPSGLMQDEFLTGVEVIPGDPSAVHHVLIYEDTSSTHEAQKKDALTPGPGYTSFGDPGVDAELVAGWVPGTVPYVYPQGMGVLLHKGSDLVIQIHYPYGSSGKTDSTKVNVRLSTSNLRQVFIAPPLNYFPGSITEPLFIPADSVKTFEAKFTIPNSFPIQGVSLLSVAPHAHLLCKKWLVFAKTPAGDTIPLIKIDNWDFHWQGFYEFQKLLYLPKGSTLFGFATYDNTANNPDNPNHPPQNVQAGNATTDEMLLVYFNYLIYLPGDENLILDSSLVEQPTSVIDPKEAAMVVATPQLYPIVPNPANHEATISYYLPHQAEVELTVTDIGGRLVKKLKGSTVAGNNKVRIDLSDLAAGEYVVHLQSGGISRSKLLMVHQ